MKLTKEILKKSLVIPGHVSEDVFENVTRGLREDDSMLEKTLVDKGVITNDKIGQAIASTFNYVFVNLGEILISDEMRDVIPDIVAKAQETIILDQEEHSIRIATAHPDNYEFITFLQKKTGKMVKVYYATPMSIERAFRLSQADLQEEISTTIALFHKESTKKGDDGHSIDESEEGAVKLVDLFLIYAKSNKASDIHIEPVGKKIIIRFRIDGVLHEVASYPNEFQSRVVSRIKILAKMRTDERSSTQDGRFAYSKDGQEVDIRVSIVPTTKGESIVLRLLSKDPNTRSLDVLGLSFGDLKKVSRATELPNGMILVVGPTGSGKTTTLYTILQKLNKSEVNIMTIEDPVEYDIDRVQQIQVNINKNLTFATGLRSIVRQDPNVIMVGEIRDNETADIAVNAAMTGHLLLSTLHTNDAVTTFPRLIEMGIDPFLVASSVSVIIAQRLVRKICNACKTSFLIDDTMIQMIRTDEFLEKNLLQISDKKDLKEIRLYKGAGCDACGHTGFNGRIGIFEVLEVTDVIRPLITKKEDAVFIEEIAKKEGMTSMFHDGISKVLYGTTTVEEVVRVVKK